MEPGSWAVDVGAGRGVHAARWAAQGLRSIALDPGKAMATASGEHGGVAAVRGRAQSLPFRDESLAMAYFHLTIHYGDWRAALTEALRVLQPGGRCVVWTLGPEHHRTSMLARWFPTIAEIDSARFPLPGALADFLTCRGVAVFTGQEIELVERPAGVWSEAVRAGFVSTLQLIDESELKAGLLAFERAHPDPNEHVRYELHWDWIRAQKAPA